MKTIGIVLLLSGAICVSHSQPGFSHYTLFDVNDISAVVRNDGLLHQVRNPASGEAGFEWPKESGKHAVYASIPWFAAKVNGQVRIAAMEWVTPYNPGFMDAVTHEPSDRSDSTNRVYKIERCDSLSWDYLHWPSSRGAPVRGDGKPLLLGDQTLWCVFNCADSTEINPFHSQPLGVEVQQTVFGYATLGGLFRNLQIIRYLIVNKSGNRLDSMYFGFWSDPDVGDPSDDRDGCDSTISLWYCYNATDNDAVYGASPPAVGYLVLQGPRVASPGNSAMFIGRRVPGYRNLPMTSFVLWPNDGWSNPRTSAHVYNYFEAYWWSLERHITYGGNGTDPNAPPTNFMYSGDPETGTGWLSSFSRHEFGGSGPFTMAPGDTQEVVMAVLISRGTSNSNSVTKLRSESGALLSVYRDSLYRVFAPPPPYIPPKEIPELYSLSLNYPNPFNAGTLIQFGLPIDARITLAVYDMLGRRVATLASGFHVAGTYTVRWEPESAATGVYVYRLEAGQYIKSRRMLLLR